MSLLLKALKQAETAHAEKTTQPDSGLALESLEPDPAKAREWLEPPGMLFGNGGLTPTPTKANRFRMQQLSLVPATALLAAIVAVGYGVYLYYELQPPAAVAIPARPAPASSVEPIAITPAPSPAISATPLPAITPAPAVTVVPAPVAPVVTVTTPTPAPRRGLEPTSTSTRVNDAPPRAARAESPPRQALPPYSLQTSSNTVLNQAYDAYQRGQLDDAQRLYTQAAARERSVDALLGLAAIAGIRNRDDEAAQRLRREMLKRLQHAREGVRVLLPPRALQAQTRPSPSASGVHWQEVA